MPDCVNTPVHFVLTGFVAVSVPAYLLFMYVIVAYRNSVPVFGKFFFRLSFGLGIADLGQIVAFAVAFKIPLQGWFRSTYLGNPWIFKYAILTQWYLYRTQQLYVLVLSFNRFTALIFPTRHGTIWHNKLAVFTILIWVLPAIYHFPMWTTTSWASIQIGNYSMVGWTTSMEDKAIMNGYSMVNLLYNVARTIFLVLLYAIAFSLSCIRKQHYVAPEANGPTMSVELRLALIGFVIVLLEVGGVIYYGYLIVAKRGQMTDICDVLLAAQFGNDSYSGINPWLLILLSTPVRQAIKSLFIKAAIP